MDWFLPCSLTWSYRIPPNALTPATLSLLSWEKPCIPLSLGLCLCSPSETFGVSPVGLNSSFKAQLWCQFLGEASSDSTKQSRTLLTHPGHRVCLHTTCPLIEICVCVALPWFLLLVQVLLIPLWSLALHTAHILRTYTQWGKENSALVLYTVFSRRSQISGLQKGSGSEREGQPSASQRLSPCRRKRHPTPVSLPGGSHGQRSLGGYSAWGREESDTTEDWAQHLVHCRVMQTKSGENAGLGRAISGQEISV